MFGSKFTPDWKIVAGTLSIMVLGIAFPYALLFGAGAMWISGGILSLVWIIQILRKK